MTDTHVDCVDNPELADLPGERIVALIGPDAPHSVVVVADRADRQTMTEPAMPLLASAWRTGVSCGVCPKRSGLSKATPGYAR